MSMVERFIPGLKDVGMKTSQYFRKRRVEGQVSVEEERLMIEQDVNKYVAEALLYDDVPTVKGFQDSYPAWEEPEYIDIIEQAIEVEKELQSGRRRTH